MTAQITNSHRPFESIGQGSLSALEKDDSLWRSERWRILEEMRFSRQRSGRLIGFLGAHSIPLADSGETVGAALHIDGAIRDFILRRGEALCPKCNLQCRSTSLEQSAESAAMPGVLLAAVELEFDDLPSRAQIVERVAYWEGSRVSNGSGVWSVDQLDSISDFALINQKQWYVVLDSIKTPSSDVVQRLRQLFERVPRLRQSGVSLLLRGDEGGQLEARGIAGEGWRCQNCAALYPFGSALVFQLGALRSDTAGRHAFLEFAKSAAQFSGDVLNQQLEVVRRAGLIEVLPELPLRELPYGKILMARIAALIICGVWDTALILDDLEEVIVPGDRNAYRDLCEALRSSGNRIIEFSSAAEARDFCDQSKGDLLSRLEPGQIVEFEDTDIAAPAGFERFADSVRKWEEGHKGKRSVSAVYAPELRRPANHSLAALCGVDSVLASLIAQSPGRSARSGSEGVLCPDCLRSGERDWRNGTREPCICDATRGDRASAGIIKGETLAFWAHAPLRAVVPRLAEFRQTSLLLSALIDLGFANWTLATCAEELSDHQLQVIRLLALTAAPDVDLFKRAGKRRAGKSRIMLLMHPFWGLGSEVSSRMAGQLRRLILPNDTIAYVDSRRRFKKN